MAEEEWDKAMQELNPTNKQLAIERVRAKVVEASLEAISTSLDDSTKECTKLHFLLVKM